MTISVELDCSFLKTEFARTPSNQPKRVANLIVLSEATRMFIMEFEISFDKFNTKQVLEDKVAYGSVKAGV